MTDRIDIPDEDMRGFYILAGALIAGAIVFAVGSLVYVLVILGNPGPTGQFMSWFMLGFGVISTVPVFVAAQLVKPQIADSADETASLIGRCRGRMILRFAGIQGACFCNIVAYLIEHNVWSIGVAGGFIFLMLAMFPTRTRVEQWVETQLMQQELN
ncbi:MAG: hypothetical protein KDA93_19700 [Planctomycetaceae bacterium]|nr:hypothetical protein [Planctomycetaceae bacterium]